MKELVIATRNRKKLAEIAEQLAAGDLRLLCAADFPEVPETVEDGETFAENAAKKARDMALALNRPSLGEDSGLCVDALGGRPGIHSARYAGRHGDDQANNQRLANELAKVSEHQRSAHYICSLAVSDPSGEIVLTSQARCCGRIVLEPRGTGGFGYDPHFLLVEYHRTFGELPAVVKRHLSHRAKAFERLRLRLLETL